MKNEPIAYLALAQCAIVAVLAQPEIPLPATVRMVLSLVAVALGAVVGRALVTPTAKLPKAAP